MTTSGRARKPPAGRSADVDTTPTAAGSLGSAAAGDTPAKGRPASALPTAPDDAGQLEREIELTREQLGETVEQLAAKADVAGRARAKAAEVSGQVKAKANQARQEAAARAGSVRSQLAGKTAAAQQKAVSAGGAGKDRLQSQVAAAGTPLWEAAPEPLRRAAAKGASGARERRVPLAVAAGALISGYLVIRWWRRR
jgi:Protein of unknown function (DUF3618)